MSQERGQYICTPGPSERARDGGEHVERGFAGLQRSPQPARRVQDCWQTQPGGAALGGNPYRVPAFGRLRSGPLEMARAPVRFGQALIVTTYLIHGLAFNKSDTRTRMALEMRFQIAR